MNFEEAWPLVPGNGWLTEDEGRLLWNAASSTTGNILEVGCYEGRSTLLLARLGRFIYTVDPFTGFADDIDPEATFAAFMRNLSDSGLKDVALFRTKLEDCEWKGLQFGFAYLDGDHTYEGTKNQICIALLRGAKVLCLHDYADNGGGAEIKRAIRDMGLTVVEVVGRMAHCNV